MFILFDIGGTNMRIAATEVLSGFEEPLILDTPQNFDEAMKLIIETSRNVAKGREIKAMVGGVPGPLNAERSVLENAPHLPDWVGKPFKLQLEEALNVSVHVENDSAMVGLGEANFGAGQGFSTVAYITVSTGVGGTRIVKGRLDKSTIGYEPGHQIIDLDHTLCAVCKSGTLEDHVSGTALKERYGKAPNEITDPSVWDDVARTLAVGIMNTTLHWTPDVVVLGGAMVVKRPGIDVADVAKHLSTMMKIYPTVPQVKAAELGALGGLYGGLAVLEQLNVETFS